MANKFADPNEPLQYPGVMKTYPGMVKGQPPVYGGFLKINMLWAQSLTSLMADLHQDIYGGFTFSRCLSGNFS